MKTIITTGVPPSMVKRFKCTKCGCVFSADQEDYRSTLYSRNEELFTSQCPECINTAYEEHMTETERMMLYVRQWPSAAYHSKEASNHE